MGKTDHGGPGRRDRAGGAGRELGMTKWAFGLARLMAALGGIVLTVLILITCLSILGRSLNGVLHGDFMRQLAPGFAQWALGLGIGPINGDFELVEAGIAFTIFAFLPICQITSGHATVDIFTNLLPRGVNTFLRALIEVIFAAVLVLIAWRLYDGMMAKKSYGETTLLLQFPLWWAYLASFFGASMAALIGVFMAGVRMVEMLTGWILIPDGPEADH